ncbi:long-chain fatty acid--CoA ligase [Kribbella sp. NBC_01245]|uniref:acyl-CoA synthetase n=1 Tax=Kribbella sp. NBC_01245 TaxID=2903578 RepID=UPI002E28D616|nr:long-chain fatty acid--CoA ligase [Kribbella sp. NBC_01245]
MLNAGLGSWPARRARMTPGRTAFVDDDHPITYGELAARVNRVADRLRAAGVGAGDRVAYLGPNHPAFVETMFATHLVGGVFVPLNFRLTASEVQYMLGDCTPSLLVHSPAYADVVASLSGPLLQVSLDSFEDWISSGSSEFVDQLVELDEIALILYTSGTTGKPKGAMLSHGNLIWNTYNVIIGTDVASDEVTLVSAPLFHVAALGQTLLPTFLKGGCCLLTSGWNVDSTYDLIARYGVTWMFGVPTMYADLANSPRWSSADLSSLRHLMCGGAAVSETLIRIYQSRGLVFCQGYGLTETSPGATFLESRESVRKAGTAGPPVFFGDIRVVGADGENVAVGEAGEVLIQGPQVSPGYWLNPLATDASLRSGWFASGDMAKVDDEGYLTIVDRVKDMFVSGGENVYPAEVENAIFGHPAVAEVAVVGVPDERWGEVGRAFIVCQSGQSLTTAELHAYLQDKLAKYKIPTQLQLLPTLPRTASGKVQKATLRTYP